MRGSRLFSCGVNFCEAPRSGLGNEAPRVSWRPVGLSQAWSPAGYSSASTPKVTGAGGRMPQETKAGHENAEGMTSFGVRVDRLVRPGRAAEAR